MWMFGYIIFVNWFVWGDLDMTRSEFSSGSKAPWFFSMATCISNDLVHSELWVSCMGSLPNCSEPPGAKCYARTHNDRVAPHWSGTQPLSLMLASICWSLQVSRFWKAKLLPATWTSCLQWVHTAYQYEAGGSAWSLDHVLTSTVSKETISPFVPHVPVSRL